MIYMLSHIYNFGNSDIAYRENMPKLFMQKVLTFVNTPRSVLIFSVKERLKMLPSLLCNFIVENSTLGLGTKRENFILENGINRKIRSGTPSA